MQLTNIARSAGFFLSLDAKSAASAAPSTISSTVAIISCTFEPWGTSPAKIIDWLSLSMLRMVLTIGCSFLFAQTFKGNNKAASGRSLALSPKYILYNSNAGLPSISQSTFL